MSENAPRIIVKELQDDTKKLLRTIRDTIGGSAESADSARRNIDDLIGIYNGRGYEPTGFSDKAAAELAIGYILGSLNKGHKRGVVSHHLFDKGVHYKRYNLPLTHAIEQCNVDYNSAYELVQDILNACKAAGLEPVREAEVKARGGEKTNPRIVPPAKWSAQ